MRKFKNYLQHNFLKYNVYISFESVDIKIIYIESRNRKLVAMNIMKYRLASISARITFYV